jgi:hypothetical protein
MKPPRLSRREFAVMAAGAAAAARCGISPLAAQSKSSLTAQQLIDRIHQHAGAGWPRNASAGLKAGSPDTPVRGIVSTSMATVEVLRQAVKSGANLIFTCEPTFFGVNEGAPQAPRTQAPVMAQAGGQPQGGPLRQQGVASTDPILLAKKALIDQNGLVIYRIGDHWTAGEDLSLALAAAMGWASNRSADDPLRYTIPARPLGAILADIRQRLGARGGLRVIGDSRTVIQRVAVLPGLRPLPDLLKYLPQSDLLLLGESRDWEGPEYASDADFAGLKKGYAQIGRVVSEDPGMAAFSTWVQTFVKEVPVQTIPATDPFWRPA